jgi:prepilin peptidase CpaA
MLSALGAGFICGGIFLIFYLAGGMGAGDVKCIAAVGALAGLTNCASILIFTSIAGGVMGLIVAVARGRLGHVLRNVTAIAGHHRQHGLTPHTEINVANDKLLRLPYALAIAAGSISTLFLFGTQR